MSKCLITSDLHFGHKKAAEWRGLENHDEYIIDRWNSVVEKRDVVYVLGDAAFNLGGVANIARLNGIKKLVMGNHDQQSMNVWLSVFRSVSAYKVMSRDILLSHIPVHPWSLTPRYRLQIHGHTHELGSPDGPYISACLEMTDYEPKTLEWYIQRVSVD